MMQVALWTHVHVCVCSCIISCMWCVRWYNWSWPEWSIRSIVMIITILIMFFSVICGRRGLRSLTVSAWVTDLDCRGSLASSGADVLWPASSWGCTTTGWPWTRRIWRVCGVVQVVHGVSCSPPRPTVVTLLPPFKSSHTLVSKGMSLVSCYSIVAFAFIYELDWT
jgi:hypothetical protein